MVISDPLVIANVVICMAIVLRLMSFRREGSSYQKWASWLAYLMILAYASVPFRFFFDHYEHTSWAIITINLLICAAVYRASGNVAVVFAVFRQHK